MEVRLKLCQGEACDIRGLCERYRGWVRWTAEMGKVPRLVPERYEHGKCDNFWRKSDGK